MLIMLQGWGNRQGIKLNKEILAEANITVGDELEINTIKEQLEIEPVRKIRGKYHLKDLVAQISPNYQVQEEDWGAPVGLEACIY